MELKVTMVGVTQSEPEVSDMAQKLVVQPIERIPAYSMQVVVKHAEDNFQHGQGEEEGVMVEGG